MGLAPDFYEKKDIHVHVPGGATPKDGPSAGIAMTLAMVSAFAKIPVRADVAMTGEITLRGEVLPIGGLAEEKLLAALRGGIKHVLIPKDNLKDLEEIPENVKAKPDHPSGQMDRRGYWLWVWKASLSLGQNASGAEAAAESASKPKPRSRAAKRIETQEMCCKKCGFVLKACQIG